MYLAEIHGKLSRNNENKEDILTSNVFSFFKYADRELFLLKLINSFNLAVTPEDAQHAEFHFWRSFPDHTEPDLVIIVGSFYLLFEAKYHSGFGKETPMMKHQLVREVEGGILEAQNLDKEFRMVVVTADHHFKRDILREIPVNNRKDLIWINWQSIAYLVDDILKNTPHIPIESKRLAEDLYMLLIKKNLRNFEGVKVLSKVHGLEPFSNSIFFQAASATYRGDFIGFSKALEIRNKIKSLPDRMFFSRKSNLFQSLQQVKLQTENLDHLFFN